jgi:hypothetical protein
VTCDAANAPSTRFFALIHDLSDCAMASIYCHESKVGPAEILAVIPTCRRTRLREEFAFEFLSFARFLGVVNAGAELQLHEAVTGAIADQSDARALAFSLSSGLWQSDLEPILSQCVEKVAVTVCQWLAESSESRRVRVA